MVTGGTAYAPANQPQGCLPYPYGIKTTPPTCPTSCSTIYPKRFDQDKTYGKFISCNPRSMSITQALLQVDSGTTGGIRQWNKSSKKSILTAQWQPFLLSTRISSTTRTVGGFLSVIDPTTHPLSFIAGVYDHTYGKLIGYHLTKLIGWGTYNGVDYWQAVNTWGTNWGQNGLFKIRRGNNTVGIESRVSTVLPRQAFL